MGSARGDGNDGGRGWSRWWSPWWSRDRIGWKMGWASWVQEAFVTSQGPCHTPGRAEWTNEGQNCLYQTRKTRNGNRETDQSTVIDGPELDVVISKLGV